MRLLFLCKENKQYVNGNYYGITGLYNSAKFVSDTLSTTHTTKLVSVVDSNSIDKELSEFQPDVVILEAIWVPPYKLEELIKLDRYKNIKWVVRSHSKPAFLANEGTALSWLIQYSRIKNVIISGNHKDFCDMMKAIDVPSVMLPNIYGAEFSSAVQDTDKQHVDVGCFGAIRPMKNQLQQAAAAIMFADSIGQTLRFHINGTRLEQNGDNVLKNIRALFQNTKHELIEHPWLEHAEFLQLVSTMDVGLQVSLSESFNIVSADFISQNIPIITSKEVEFVSSLFQTEPHTAAIVKSLVFAYRSRLFRLHMINKWLLTYSNNKATHVWLDFIQGLK